MRAGDRRTAERDHSVGTAKRSGLFQFVCSHPLARNVQADATGADFSVDRASDNCCGGGGVVQVGDIAKRGPLRRLYDRASAGGAIAALGAAVFVDGGGYVLAGTADRVCDHRRSCHRCFALAPHETPRSGAAEPRDGVVLLLVPAVGIGLASVSGERSIRSFLRSRLGGLDPLGHKIVPGGVLRVCRHFERARPAAADV